MPQKAGKEKLRCHVHDNVLNSLIEEIRQNVCVNESDFPLTKHKDGKYYCLFHLPVFTKDRAKFDEIFHKKLSSIKERIDRSNEVSNEKTEQSNSKIPYDFRFVWFPNEVNLRNYKFEVAVDFSQATISFDADFMSAVFSAEAYFSKTVFSAKANFNLATFSAKTNFAEAAFSKDGGIFDLATFSDSVTFSQAEFSGQADFSHVNFYGQTDFYSTKFLKNVTFSLARFQETSQISFQYTEFHGFTNFYKSIIAGYVIFEGNKESVVFINNSKARPEALLDLQNALLEKPERVSFYRVRLCPGWFVNVDSRKMTFIDIKWSNLHKQFRDKSLKANLKSLSERNISEPNSLLEIACRQLAVNAEENNRYDEALSFRKMANESKRLAEYKGFKVVSLHWWYWLSSFYGESWKRAAGVLLVVLLGFAWIYTRTDFQICPNNKPLSSSISECEITPEKCKCEYGGLSSTAALAHSVATALFQNVEYRKPLTIWGELSTYLEKILAPLQAALLALAIRRKFMR